MAEALVGLPVVVKKPSGGAPSNRRGSPEAIAKRRAGRAFNVALGAGGDRRRLDGRSQKRRQRLLSELSTGRARGSRKPLKPLDVLSRIKGDFIGERSAQFGDENGLFEREDVQVGWAEFEGVYRWTLDPGDGSEPEIYSGTAVFYIEERTSGWVLVRWEDVDVVGSYPTSGNLRGTFRAAN